MRTRSWGQVEEMWEQGQGYVDEGHPAAAQHLCESLKKFNINNQKHISRLKGLIFDSKCLSTLRRWMLLRVSHFSHFSPNLYAPKICQSLWYKNDLPKFSEFSYPVFLSRFQFSLYIGFSRKIQRKSDHRIFFIFKILTGHYHNFRAWGRIVEILTELLTPILTYGIFVICHLSYVVYDINDKYVV